MVAAHYVPDLTDKISPEIIIPGSPYLITHHPLLRKVANSIPPAKIKNEENQEIIDQMLGIGKKEPNMAGLAAPQIGVSKQIIIISDKAFANTRPEPNGKAENTFQIFINPVITKRSDDEESDVEGCFSAPGYMGVVPRVKSISVSAYDRNGKEVHGDFSGFTARVFQHEIDHLNGFIYPDRIFQLNPDSKQFHFLSTANDSVEHQKERLQEYRETFKKWKDTHGNADGFTWPDTISKIKWERDIVKSQPEWEKDPLPPPVK
ncbi:peptide deformylase [Enterobacter hormaechei]|nr:peptide deformylase [Enterobacter hormaechei]